MSKNVSDAGDAHLVTSLRHVLTDLTQNPYPYVPNPESCKKRASVALILRVRPHASHWPSSSIPSPDIALPAPEYLEQFFAQSWVQNGDPEVIFIKRATRVGDRWTGHVALPGGKRDAEDEDDKAAAIRETSEEIGLDLTSPNAFFIGNLPERVVSTAWGKVPIMVLCPFVFLWTKPDIPPLKLQPTEVASTHWVPLRVLLSPSTRTYEYVDVADRFAKQGGPVLKTAVRSVIGKMRFSAIRLIPSESLYCSSTPEFFDEGFFRQSSLGMNKVWNLFRGTNLDVEDKATRPLLLWGLTLGMLVDLLNQLPPHNAVELWSHPTFTSLDVRLIVNILTERLKRRNWALLQESGNGSNLQNQTAMDSETQAVVPAEKGKNAERSHAVGVMLEGYYDKARLGVWMAVALRSIGTLAAIMYATRRYRQRHI